jgi:hypothetical protein
MTEKKISDFSKELYAAVDRIFKEKPDEIRRMKQDLNAPRMRAFFKVNYTFHELKSITEILGVSVSCANEGMSLDCIKSMVTRFIEHQCILMVSQGLHDTVKLLRDACNLMEEAQTLQEYLEIVEPLSIYATKMGPAGWLDYEQHWSEVSSAWDIIDSIKHKKYHA